MSLDKLLKKKSKERRAEVVCNNSTLVVTLQKCFLLGWTVMVQLYGSGYDTKDFWRRKSADKYFNSLVSKYNLKEE